MFDDMRQQAGFGSLPPLDALWQPRERIISTSLAAFDGAPIAGWEMVRHAGPVLEDEKFVVPRALPWPSVDPTPLVMVSFSTMFEQRNADKMQRTLDGLADFQVHVVATTAAIVAPSELAVPDNAVVLDYAAHDPIVKRAALVVTHGGHGTAMRALRHGVPMILIPGLAGDQPFVAAAIQEFGAGLALPGDAGVEAIHEAAHRILSTPSFKQNAQERAKALAGIDGAANAADEVESLLDPVPSRGAATAVRRLICARQPHARRRGAPPYFANSSSAAVMMPVSGCAAQYSPSFLALATNFSVSITGGSSSPR